MDEAKKKSPGIGLLIGMSDEDDAEMDLAAETKKAAAEDALAAFKSNDADALSAALERHHRAVMSSEAHDEESETEG